MARTRREPVSDLAIVKEIIQAHGENINVISTEGVGTEFIFTLPLAKGKIRRVRKLTTADFFITSYKESYKESSFSQSAISSAVSLLFKIEISPFSPEGFKIPLSRILRRSSRAVPAPPSNTATLLPSSS